MLTVFWYTLRRFRGQILGWGIALALLAALIVGMYDSIADQQAQFEILLESYPPELMAFMGADDMATSMFTPEGFVSYEFFSWMPIVIGIFAVLMGSGLLASDEEKGTLDLILAHPLSRTQLFMGRLLAFVTATLGILAIVWLGFVVTMNWSINMNIGWGRMCLPLLALLAELLLFGALALLLSMVLPSRRMAASVAGLALVASFFITSLARIDERLETVAKLSPLNYYQSGEAIHGLNWQWLGGLLLATMVFVLLAWWRFWRRDIRVGGEGGWRLPSFSRLHLRRSQSQRSPEPGLSARQRPSDRGEGGAKLRRRGQAVLLAVQSRSKTLTVFGYTLRRLRGQILGWGIALGLLVMLVVSLYGAFADQQAQLDQILAAYPPELMAFFGIDTATTSMFSPEGFISVEFFSFAPVIIGIFAVLVGSGLLAGDEEKGTLDLILAHPVSRTSLFMGRLLAFVTATVGILAIVWLGFSVATSRSSMGIGWGAILLPLLSLLAVLLVFSTLALLLSMVLPSRGMAASVAGFVMVASYFVSSLATIDERLETVAKLSPLSYYQSGEAIHGLNWQWLGGLLLVAVIFTLLAWWRFWRRDIRVGGERGWRLPSLSLPFRRSAGAGRKA